MVVSVATVVEDDELVKIEAVVTLEADEVVKFVGATVEERTDVVEFVTGVTTIVVVVVVAFEKLKGVVFEDEEVDVPDVTLPEVARVVVVPFVVIEETVTVEVNVLVDTFWVMVTVLVGAGYRLEQNDCASDRLDSVDAAAPFDPEHCCAEAHQLRAARLARRPRGLCIVVDGLSC